MSFVYSIPEKEALMRISNLDLCEVENRLV